MKRVIHVPEVFGDYESRPPQSDIDDGMYNAKILSAAIERDGAGEPKKTDEGKFQARVRFGIDDHFRPDGQPEELFRRYTISYGQNSQTAQWAAWAVLCAAATGISCGDARQKKISDQELAGAAVRVVVKRVLKNGNEYVNIVDVMSPAKPRPAGNGAARTQHAAQPAQQAQARGGTRVIEQKPITENDGFDDESWPSE